MIHIHIHITHIHLKKGGLILEASGTKTGIYKAKGRGKAYSYIADKLHIK